MAEMTKTGVAALPSDQRLFIEQNVASDETVLTCLYGPSALGIPFVKSPPTVAVVTDYQLLCIGADAKEADHFSNILNFGDKGMLFLLSLFKR